MSKNVICKGIGYIGALKNVDKKTRIMSGYYTAFENEDSDGDIGTKGMTLKSIAETGPRSLKPRIKHFLNHNITQPLGLLTDMGEDAIGAYYTSQIGDHNLGLDFIKMADSGLITEHSYGLTPLLRDPKNQQRMLQVKVWEVSPLTAWGANSETPFISLGKAMNMTAEQQLQYWVDKQAAVEKFCRNSDATDETIEALLIEVKYLTQHIIELTNTTQTAKASDQPGTQDYSALLSDIQSINF